MGIFASVDRLDLIAWLHSRQKQAEKWQRRFFGLLRDLEVYHEYLIAPDKEEARKSRFFGMWGNLKTYLAEEDALGALLKAHKDAGGL